MKNQSIKLQLKPGLNVLVFSDHYLGLSNATAATEFSTLR